MKMLLALSKYPLAPGHIIKTIVTMRIYQYHRVGIYRVDMVIIYDISVPVQCMADQYYTCKNTGEYFNFDTDPVQQVTYVCNTG